MLRVIGLTLVVVTVLPRSGMPRPGTRARPPTRSRPRSGTLRTAVRRRSTITMSCSFRSAVDWPLPRPGRTSSAGRASWISPGPTPGARGGGRRLARIGPRLAGRTTGSVSPQSTKPTLAYAVNNSLSVGLNYHYDSGENMNFKLARVGGIDANFHSHNIMFEAYFEF